MVIEHEPSRRCLTERQSAKEHVFYMRELERNIIHCHQKYKKDRKRTLSQTKSAPILYKSTKQTAIEFEQINFGYTSESLAKEANGTLLFQITQQLRNIEMDSISRQNRRKTTQEMDEKLKLLKKTIERKKESKAAHAQKQARENKHFLRILKQQQKMMTFHYKRLSGIGADMFDSGRMDIGIPIHGATKQVKVSSGNRYVDFMKI